MLSTLYNKINQIYQIAVVVFLLLFPLWTDYRAIDPVNGGRLVLMLYFSFILLGLSLLRIFLQKKALLHITILDILICVFFLYKIVHLYIIDDFGSISEKYTAISLWMFYFIFRNLEKSKLPRLFYTLLLSSFIQCLNGQLQLWGIFKTHSSAFEITGSFFNPAPYSGFLSMTLPIAIILFLLRNQIQLCDPFFKKWNIGKIAFIVMCFILIVLPSTKSRAAWAASLLVTIVILWDTYLKNTTKNLFLKYRFLFLVSLLVVAIVAGYGMYHLKKDSANGRLFIWQTSAIMVKEKPIFGSGVDDFQRNYMLYQAYFFKTHPEHPATVLADNVSYVYNEPYKVLIELGIIGFFLVICIGACILFPFVSKETNIFCKIAQMALLSLLIFGLFSYPSAILLLQVSMVFFISIVVNYSKPVRIVKLNYSMMYGGVCLLGFLICAPFAFNKMKTYHKALHEWKQGLILYNKEKYLQSLKYFDAAFSTLKTDGIFLIQCGKTLSLYDFDDQAAFILNQATYYQNNTILYIALGDCYKKLGQYQKAEDSYLIAYNMVPNRIYPLYLLAKLYKETGQSAKFEEMADKVLNNQPKVKSKAIDEMKTEIQQLKEN